MREVEPVRGHDQSLPSGKGDRGHRVVLETGREARREGRSEGEPMLTASGKAPCQSPKGRTCFGAEPTAARPSDVGT